MRWALCRVLTVCSCCAEQKNAIAVAHCKRGKGVLNVNGYPIDGLLPESMRYKVFEPVLLIGNDKFKEVDIRVKVRGGGNTSQIFGALLSFSCDACAVDATPLRKAAAFGLVWACGARAGVGLGAEAGARTCSQARLLAHIGIMCSRVERLPPGSRTPKSSLSYTG